MDHMKCVVPARPQWRELLTDMWEEAFGDSRERIGLFHKYFPVEKYAWCYVEGDRPLSVIYALPAWRWKGAGRQAVRYLYAGSTKRENRGSGYYGRLLQAVCGGGMWDGDVRGGDGGGEPVSHILVPVPELIPYYEKLGFVLMEKEEEEEVVLDGSAAQEKEMGPGADMTLVRKTDAPRYKEIRDLRLGGPGYVEWDENYLAYALESLEADGGQALEICLDGKFHILLGRTSGQCLSLTETSLTAEELAKRGGLLRRLFGCGLAVRKGTVLMGYEKAWEEKPYFKIPLDD